MFAVKGSDIKRIDSEAQSRFLIPAIVLMENAAIASCNVLTGRFNPSKCSVICGSGNNGGDGFALARHLKNRNLEIEVVLLGSENRFSDETKINFKILKKLGVKVLKNPSPDKFKKILSSSQLIIDAVFGTGFHNALDSFHRRYFKIINHSKIPVLSLDIPSGIDSNTGEFDSDAIRASVTVTFGFVKTGLLWSNASERAGELIVADISIPVDAIFSKKHYLIIEKEILNAISADSSIRKNEWTHKTEKGKASFVGGGEGMEGSIQFASYSALKSGAGIVYVYMLSQKERRFFPELVFTDNLNDALKKSNVWVIGCGMQNNLKSKEILLEAVKQSKGKTILFDADALNIISSMNEADKRRILRGSIITPHPEEFFRLSKMRFNNISEKIYSAEKFAKKYNALVVLKSPPTIITDSKTTMIFPNMNSKLATAGSGDILSGIIGGLMAQGYSPMASSALGVYIHFYSGERSSSANPTASQFINNISKVRREVINV